ncbi:MAG: hypothetical protein CMF62_05270 [Magnetococcales bacterium]|nr:hypothetical protein [Magnetococcales bacterium]
MIRIESIQTPKQLNDFVHLPHKLYKGDENYIPQLDMERRTHFSKKHNPFFDHADAELFVAYDVTGKAVGRISAQIDKEETEHKTTGHFGAIEADTPETMRLLLTEAEEWLRSKGIKHVTGPYSLSINDEVGLLVDGYTAAPRLMMNYAKPWYQNVLEDAGYVKAKDLYAYNLDVTGDFPKTADRMSRAADKKEGLVERKINMKNLSEDLHTIIDIFNDAWANNWGFTPMTAAEIAYMVKNLRPIIDADLARIVELDGHPIAMIVALPDVNEAMHDLGGKLLPFGWLKLLTRLKANRLKGARVVLMGVRQEYQSTPLGGAIAISMMRNAYKIGVKKGIEHVELSWILENNTPMIRLIEMIGGTHYKTYRVYAKDLG